MDADQQAWRDGFKAGKRLASPSPPFEPGTLQAWSWHRGFIEGAAMRMGRCWDNRPPVDLEWSRLLKDGAALSGTSGS